MADIARRVITDDPVETANQLTTIKLIGRSARDAVQTDPIGAFHKRLNRIGTVAHALYETAKPDNGEPPAYPDDEPGNAARRAGSVAPILRFQSAGRKAATVDHILDLSRISNNAAPILAIAGHLGSLDHANRRRLLDQTIELFKDGYSNPFDHQAAASTLVVAHEHLEVDQKAALYDALRGNEDLSDRLAEADRRERLFGTRMGSSKMVKPYSADVNTSIDAIENSFQALQADRGAETLKRLSRIRKLGNSINNAYNRAREELMGSVRSRENVGR
ncbi:hypothetical protein [Bradyrhizobium sp. Leo121]|uniref:hypothetical protein n=1 Tax=Bradyrhizobium sp. Leo121 TaxID=1571195 RepID=UPI001028E3FD|nr:hypothetical protein [Bradyrhizobium sp. Leo121]RZN10899.1 hypothetical protein CWO90_46715 [Bradyrhizobium sp. Leo121]